MGHGWSRAAGALALAACLAGAGCGGDGAEPSAHPTTTTTTGATTTTTTDAVPAELHGRWRRTSAQGERITLTVTATSYQLRRGPGSAGGSLRVRGDTMSFTMTHCEGTGDYRWRLEGDQLTLTMLGDDPCPNRSDELVGAAFTAER